MTAYTMKQIRNTSLQYVHIFLEQALFRTHIRKSFMLHKNKTILKCNNHFIIAGKIYIKLQNVPVKSGYIKVKRKTCLLPFYLCSQWHAATDGSVRVQEA